MCAGGAKAMALEHGLKRGKEETRRAARVVGYLERRNFRLDPRLAALGNARRLLRQPMAARTRLLHNQEIGYGFAADSRGRWAVEQIVEWRGSGAEREALVRWCGFDPTTDAPWDETWEPRAWLTSDLRAGGVIRRRRTAEQMREVARSESEDWAERHLHTRRSQRLRAEDSEEENSLHVPT